MTESSTPDNEELAHLLPAKSRKRAVLVAVLVVAMFVGTVVAARVVRPAWEEDPSAGGGSSYGAVLGWPYAYAEISKSVANATGTLMAIEDQPGAQVIGVWMTYGDDTSQFDLGDAARSLVEPLLPGEFEFGDPLPTDWPAPPTPDELVAMLAAAGAPLDEEMLLPQPARTGQYTIRILWRVLDCQLLRDTDQERLLVRVRSVLGFDRLLPLASGPGGNAIVALAQHSWSPDEQSTLVEAHSCP
jgi:hypothetical protein